MDRTTRQRLCIKNWLDNNGIGLLQCCVGFGKTTISLIIIKMLIKKNPNIKVLISVPTDILKQQWLEKLVKYKLFKNCDIVIINTIIRNEYSVDLLIIDEIHLIPSDTRIKIFDVVKYKYILGLTGTLNRLDGKESLLTKHCPVIDKITMEEAIKNNWLSNYREYKVLLEVDLTEYNELNKKFNNYFSYFDYDFNRAMTCVKNINYRRKWASFMGVDSKTSNAVTMDFMRCLKQRKDFVNKHPKKIEIANKILSNRLDKKCITFSGSIDQSKLIKFGNIINSKQTKVKNKKIIESFNNVDIGVLNTVFAADCGLDINGLSVGVILSGTSSKIQKNQRIGRTIRFEENKVSEIFSIIIKNTIDESWYANSTKKFITIDENQLDLILNGSSVETRERDVCENVEYRF